jgi:SAM-dependent methyltransferase
MRVSWHGTSVRWLSGKQEAIEAFAGLADIAHAVEQTSLARGGARAYCTACADWRWLQQPPTPEGEWANMLEGMVCACGLNGRMRLILSSVDALLSTHRDPLSNVVVFERMTPLFQHLQRRFPDIRGSEYISPGLSSGDQREIGGILVQHQDMLLPSYKDNSQDLVMHFDVLEHVPDHRRALAQCHRILKPGGRMIFTCPFYSDLDKSIVRAEMIDGEIKHLLPPAYHGNPVDPGGALVFIHPGWDILSSMESTGFIDTGLLLCYDPSQAIYSNASPYPDGLVWPVAIIGSKPAVA